MSGVRGARERHPGNEAQRAKALKNYSAALALACQSCGAPAGEPCTFSRGTSREGLARIKPHDGRLWASRAPRDAGSAEVVGVVIMVGVVLLLAATAALLRPPELPWSSATSSDAKAWTYCEEHAFEKPACDAGKPYDSTGDGSTWCKPIFPGQESSPLKCVEVSAAVLCRVCDKVPGAGA